MKLPLQSNPNQTISEPRRRSSRLLLKSYPFDQRPADSQASQSVETTSNTRIPTSSSITTAAPGLSKAQFQETCKTVQQSTPLSLKRPHALFHKNTINLLPSNSAPKRYCPESVDRFVTQWVESASRERHCRSDTLLGHSDGDIILRRLTKSAPNMEYKQNADENDSWHISSVVPSNISGASTDSSGKKSLVESPLYRAVNLTANNIYIRSSREQFPDHIASLVDYIRKDRDSLSLSPDQVWQDISLEILEMGTGEPDVENYFKNKIFDQPEPLETLKRSDRLPMAKHVVPNFGSKFKISTPVPDMLYGYSRSGAFTEGQQVQFNSMENEMVANSQDLIYPFFVIEFKADGTSGGGSLWVATNQCLGSSASCINLTERLNRRLRCCESDKIQPIDSASFSIVMSGTEARLYVSWKHDELKYYMQKINSFLLQRPTDHVEFCKYVRNIIDWGKNKRLNEIQESLDSLLEENRKIASQQAKSRPPPLSDDLQRRRK